MIAVQLKDLSYSYHDGTRALQKISLNIQKGKKTAILGSNGSGKTTLLYHFNGTFIPQSGSVMVAGYEVNKENLRQIRQKVGLLFDNPDNQLISTTVYNDVAFGPRNLKLNKEEVAKRVHNALRKVGMGDLQDKPPHNLSLGQKKKAAIAGLLAMEPELLVCDEPFSGLDSRATGQLTAIFDKLTSGGCTLVFSTHDVDLAYAWADEVAILHEGSLLAAGDPGLLADSNIMGKALLNIPMLAALFKDGEHRPRNLAEAMDLLSSKDTHNIILEKQVSKKR